MAMQHAHHGDFFKSPSSLPFSFSWKTAGWWLSGIFILAAVVFVAMRFTEISKIIDSFSHLSPSWVLLALFLQIFSYVFAAGVWWLVARSNELKVSFASLVLLSVGQVFARQVVPSGGVSGSLLVMKGLRNRNIPTEAGAACLMVNMISFYLGYAAALAIALAIFSHHHALSHRLETAGFVVLGLAIILPFAVLRLWKLQAHKEPPRFVHRWNWLENAWEALQDARARMPKGMLPLIETASLQLGVFAVDAATLFVVLLAFGFKPSATSIFAVHVMANAVGTMTPVPLGLGAYEAACIWLLHRAGVEVNTAISATLVFRGLTFWLPMVPGLFIARRELKGRT